MPAGERPPAPGTWRIRAGRVDLTRPFVVGIVNITPDSFSDGGLFDSPRAAIEHVERLVAEGADAVDIGGESTRPQGARAVSAAEERSRVVPIVRAVRGLFSELPISVDTTKSEVATAALDAGADVINDVSAFRLDPRMSEIVAASGAGVILMHSRGGVAEMGTYRYAQYGGDPVAELLAELQVAVAAARAAGVPAESIVLDPGVGFAKRTEHSLRVLAELPRVAAMGFPVMVGVSRKRFVGELSRVERASERVAGTVGANVTALLRGARLFRVHDVAPNRQALDVAWGILRAGPAYTRSGQNLRPPDHGSDPDRPDSRSPIPDSR
jgi:dihydropteroate synthase